MDQTPSNCMGYQFLSPGKFWVWLAPMSKSKLMMCPSKNPPDWQEILTYFRGSELQNYFTRMLEDNLKPQYVDDILKSVRGNVGQVLEQYDERDMKAELCVDLELNQVMDQNVGDLSGGELQRLAIAMVAMQNADIYIYIYMFDEPSSYLDVRQRLKAAQVIRSLLRPNSYVMVVEHDLSVLDYLSDFICCLYGKPGAYGVVTLPFSVREGINIFLARFVPTENLRFQEDSLTFKRLHRKVQKRFRHMLDIGIPP